MRTKLLLLAFLFPGYVLIAQTKTYWSPEQCIQMKNITAVRVSPDGKKVLYTVREAVMTDDRSEYVNQVFVSNTDGSNIIQLTRGDKNNANPNKFVPFHFKGFIASFESCGKPIPHIKSVGLASTITFSPVCNKKRVSCASCENLWKEPSTTKA